jgi:hypothetical protein
MKTLMSLCAILCASLLIGCGSVPKPKGWVKVINAQPKKAPSPYALWFNFETDFDEDGRLKKGVPGVNRPITLKDLHANWCMDHASKENLEAYARKLKDRYDGEK